MHRLAVAVLALTLAGAPALAAEAPPSRVGRVSLISGQLAFHSAGESDWSAAAVNFPVATGGSFWTGPRSRAEFRIGPQTIDLSGDTALDITRLDGQVMRLNLPQGRIELRVRELGGGASIEIDLARGGVFLLQPGTYDIDAGSAELPARIAVFDGSARVVGGPVDIAVKPGDMAVLNGTGDAVTATLARAAPDAFARWCRARDDHAGRLAATRYVSPHMTGYEELDAYGHWRTVAGYGEVWYPSRLPPAWVPYRYGSWIWFDPWGWTWVDAEPWGFAPSHYGRWAYLDGGWGWFPGTFIAEPVYAPALVAFLEDPAAVLAAAVAGPVVGWFPLGPWEPFWPSYTSDPAYIQAINAAVVRDPAHLDPATASVPLTNRGATIVVPQNAFAQAAPIARAALPVTQAAARAAPIAARPPAAASRPVAAAPAVASRPAAPGPTAHAAAAPVSAAPAGRGVNAASLRVRTTQHFAAARIARAAPAHLIRGRVPHIAAWRAAHAGPPRFAAPRFTAPRFTAPRGGPHFAAAPHFVAAPHLGGGPHVGGGRPPGGGPHAGAGGGGPHGGGKGHG